MKGHEPINGGFATANTFTSLLRESPLPLYRSAALVKVLLERLRRANRALGFCAPPGQCSLRRGAALRNSRSAELGLRPLSVESNRAAKSLPDERDRENRRQNKTHERGLCRVTANRLAVSVGCTFIEIIVLIFG